MSTTPSASPVVLSTAAVWGTTVLAHRALSSGESLIIGDGLEAAIAKPDGCAISDAPVRAVGKGWELDARGATGGVLHLRGREEDPARLAASGAPIPIVSGDHGLLQYGSFAVFFQFQPAAPKIGGRFRLPWPLVLAMLFSAALMGGGLLLLRAITTPREVEKPLELTSAEELAVRFRLDEEPPPPPPSTGDDSAGKGIKDPGAKDKKDQGGGKKAKGAEGSVGKQGEAEDTKMTGEVQGGLGAMSEVLDSEVGQEIRDTLGSISSVADALGGLKSDSIVLGRGGGLGFKGGGSGGGGDGDGVPFGSGTLSTGFGPGEGGGFGRGSGGPGGKGLGGRGRGGKGNGDGEGGGERAVAGKEKAASGQGLTPGQIQRVVNSRYGAFRACYESAAARNPGLTGSVAIAWTVTPAGTVSGARIARSSLGSPRVEGCILRQFSRLRFPQADKATNANYPFLFKPGKR